MEYIKRFEGFGKKRKSEQHEEKVEVGDRFIGKKDNEYKNKTITITKHMLSDDEELYFFLHYYGFEKIN